MTLSNERLRSLMNQVHGPRVGGSPSAWQWRVDEASEQHCIQVVLEDALAGSIYESGAPEVRVIWLFGSIRTLSNWETAALRLDHL